jgi:predicted HTH transcriptional regulator
MLETIAWNDFLTIINNPETPKFTYVPNVDTSQSITKAAITLANQKGGVLVLGFDKNNVQLRGVTFDAKWLNAVLYNEIKPVLIYSIQSTSRNNKRIFIVTIPEGKEKPYTTFGITEIETHVKEIPELELSTNNVAVQTRQQRALDYLKVSHIITNAKYRELNAVSHKTAHNELSDLVRKGQARQVGQGRTTSYVLTTSDITSPIITQPEVGQGDDSMDTESPENLFGETIDALINTESYSKTKVRTDSAEENMVEHFTNSSDFT